MRDDDVVKECAIIFHNICADRATGYPGLLAQLSRVRGEYWDVQQSVPQMKFLHKSQQCHIASFKYDNDIRPPMVFGLFQ